MEIDYGIDNNNKESFVQFIADNVNKSETIFIFGNYALPSGYRHVKFNNIKNALHSLSKSTIRYSVIIIVDNIVDKIIETFFMSEVMKKTNIVLTFNYKNEIPVNFICIDIKINNDNIVNLITCDPYISNLVLNNFISSFIR